MTPDLDYFSGTNLQASSPSPSPITASPPVRERLDKARFNPPPARTGVYDPVLFNIMELPPKKFARQIALVDMSFFKKIEREELLSLAWNGPEKWKKAPNIVTFIQRFNNLTLWVSNEILASQNVRRRAEKVEHFISIAKCCYECQNFNGLKSILGGLQCTPVYRLARTWALIGRSKSTLDSLAELMSTENNSEKYRKKLAKGKSPSVPYLGVHLSDIIFSVEARNKAVDKATCNKNIDDLLSDIFAHRQQSYDYKEIPPALEFLSSPKFIAELEPFYEDKNFQLSLQLEPKGDFEPGTPPSKTKTPTHVRNAHSLGEPGIFDIVDEANDDSKLPEALRPNVLSIDNSDSDSDTDADDLNIRSKFFTADNREIINDTGVRLKDVVARKDVSVDFNRAKNRSWKKYLAVLKAGSLMFYKEKHANTSHMHAPFMQMDVTEDSFVSVAHDYKKRTFVIRFLPERGTEMLLEVETEGCMNQWVMEIERCIQEKRNPTADLINLNS